MQFRQRRTNFQNNLISQKFDIFEILYLSGLERELQKMHIDVYRNVTYNKLRTILIEKLAALNTVCNTEGKGRDDLTELEILQAAEKVPEELLIGEAQSIQIMAEKIRSSFACFRILLQKYSENIDSVDPQLRNNHELVEILNVYEESWTQGREQIVDEGNRR